ncbi:T9SS type A sorting domain-containing protein [bacterium]|nr:T9SS type A sorting domain-containing protein [bacterium]
MMTARKIGWALVVALTIATLAFAKPQSWTATDKDQGVLRPSSERIVSGSLDEDVTEFRYLKTADYGVTWTDFLAAGTLETFAPSTTGFGDFSAITTDGNEICFVCYLPTAATPGVYSVTGPSFTPVLVMAEGTNDLAVNNGGWADAGRLPNGDLICIIWGIDASGGVTFWAVKSTDDGASWGTPWVLIAAPTLQADAAYPHISQLNASDYFFIIYQDEADYGQYTLRCPTSGGAATMVSLGAVSGSQVSYYTANCDPIGYDPDEDALYACHRASDLSGVAVYYSGDLGMTWNPGLVASPQRYPSVALNTSSNTPWVISNYGVPGAPGVHQAWASYDEFGYNGGSWTSPSVVAEISFDGGDFWLLYMNQLYWFDANRGIASLGQWGSFTPDGIRSCYTTDGGATWTDDVGIYHYEEDQIDAGTVQNPGMTGGSNGVAYIYTSGMHGVTDIEGPVVTGTEAVTAATNPGPWVIKAYITDNIYVDGPDWVRLERMFNPVDAGTWFGQWGNEGGGADSCQGCDPNGDNSGWYFFTLPTTHSDGSAVQQGDTIYYQVHATDPPGNSNDFYEIQALVVGATWLGVEAPAPSVSTFELVGNYPNPFNPTTTIEFTLGTTANVSLTVFNTLGQEVASLARNDQMSAGTHKMTFDGANLTSGVYLYTLSAGSFSETRKMVLVK